MKTYLAIIALTLTAAASSFAQGYQTNHSYRYNQSTGHFYNANPYDTTASNSNVYGYSGTSSRSDATPPYAGRNNPYTQEIRNTGPIPRGTYTVPRCKDEGTQKDIMILQPTAGTNTYGRGGLEGHGNNATTNDASKGCIILPRQTRKEICDEVRRGHEVKVTVEDSTDYTGGHGYYHH